MAAVSSDASSDIDGDNIEFMSLKDASINDEFAGSAVGGLLTGWARRKQRLRVLFVTLEVIGPSTNGGIGTALTSLAHSLAEEGHNVTILFLLGGVPGYEDIYQQWVDFYSAKGIELVGLRQRPSNPLPSQMVKSVDVLHYIQEKSKNGDAFDIVHCHDYLGACYYSMLSKRQGEPTRTSTSSGSTSTTPRASNS